MKDLGAWWFYCAAGAALAAAWAVLAWRAYRAK